MGGVRMTLARRWTRCHSRDQKDYPAKGSLRFKIQAEHLAAGVSVDARGIGEEGDKVVS